MRNNYIYKYMYFLVCTVLMFSACAEEELVNEVSGKEGLPVTVSLQVTEPGDMVQASRALTAGQERHMNDLYILIFDMLPFFSYFFNGCVWSHKWSFLIKCCICK